MIIFSDLHLKTETEEICFEVLDGIRDAALQRGDHHIVFLGDFWHLRYNVPVALLNKVRRILLEWGEKDLKVGFLPGNHDQIDVAGSHALEVFSDLPHVTVYTEPQWDEHGLWVPYRKKKEDLQAALKLRKPRGTPNICFIHCGLAGAEMNGGHIAEEWEGIPLKWVSKFDHVYAGHWHRHQVIKNWTYVGSPWQTRADEWNQLKGYIHAEGADWVFYPQNWGPTYQKVTSLDDLEGIKPTDKIRGTLPKSKLKEAQDFLKEIGVTDAILTPLEEEEAQERLDVALGASLQEYAEAYVDKFAEDLPKEDLMVVFREIA